MESTKEYSQDPLVSVIIPAYNAEAFIAETIRSVLSQTYVNLEIFVIDDGSTDKTAEIVKEFIDQDKRLTLLRQSNQGVAAARNLGIENSRGEFIAPIDADDIWLPEKIQQQVECFLKFNLRTGLVYSWSFHIDEHGHVKNVCSTSVEEEYVYPALLLKNFIGHASAPLIHRKCFHKVGFYDPDLLKQNAQGCEDWDLYLRIAERYHYRVVPKFLVGYRKVSNSMSCNLDAMVRSQCLVMQKARHRHPEIADSIFRWSTANFYFYMSILAISQKKKLLFQSFEFLWRAVKLEPILLLNHRLYFYFLSKLALECLQVVKPGSRAIRLFGLDITSAEKTHLRISELQKKAEVRLRKKTEVGASQSYRNPFLKHKWQHIQKLIEVLKASHMEQKDVCRDNLSPSVKAEKDEVLF